MNSKFNKKRILSFLTAFVMMINIFTNTNAFAEITTNIKDYGVVKVVTVDGKPIQVNSPQDVEKYKAEFEKKLEELKKNGYTVLNSKVTISEPTVILTNDKKDGTYMMNGQEWKESEVKYSSNPGAGPVSLIGLTNTTTSAKIYAYCIDLFTAVSPGHVYTNEYIENLQYAAFKNNEAKLRTIVANSIGNVDIKTIRAAVGDQEITEEHAVRATQLLIWKIVHGGEYVAKRTQFNAGGVNVEFTHLLKFKSPSGNDTYIPYSTRGELVRDRVWHATKVYKVLEYLDKLPVVNQLTNLPEPEVSLKNLTISKVENQSLFKISYDYSYSGKNSSGTDVKVDKTYYENTQELKSNMYNEVETKNSDGSRHVDITISEAYLKSGRFNVKLSVLQSLDITNALLSKTDDRKKSQTLITTKSTRNNRTAVIEGTVEYNNSQKAYSVSLKKVDSTELEKGNVTKGLSNAKFEVKDANGKLVDTQTTGSNGIVTFANLKVGAYTIKEVSVPNGYKQLVQDIKLTVEESGVIRALVDGKLYSTADGSTLLLPIPNVKNETVDLIATKKWENVSATETNGLRATIQLVKNGTVVQGADKVITGNGTVVFNGLPKYDERNVLIKYELREVPVKGYVLGTVTPVTTQNTAMYNFTNTKIGTTTATATKTWAYTNPSQINSKVVTVRVYRGIQGVTPIENVEATDITQTITGNNTVTFNNLPDRNEQGQLYYYVVKEDADENSRLIDSKISKDSTFVNEPKNKETVKIQVEKKWSGVSQDKLNTGGYSATFTLLQNGKKYGNPVTISGEGTATFSNLPKYDRDNTLYKYEVSENPVTGFTSVKTGVETDGKVTFTNKPTNPDTIVYTAKKLWKGALKSDKKEATIQLVRVSDKKVMQEKTVKGDDTVTFDAVPKYNDNNQAIKYELVEKDVADFTSEVYRNDDGDVITFINTRNTGELDFTKVDVSTDPVPGATIEFYRADGTFVLSGVTDARGKIVAGTAKGETSRITSEGRIKLETGKYYFLEKNAPEGYLLNTEKHEFEITKDAVKVDKLTNTRVAETSVTAKKTWEYTNPTEAATKIATFELYADGKATGNIKTTTGNSTVEFANLKATDANGKAIAYEIKEVASTEYTQSSETTVLGKIFNFFNRSTDEGNKTKVTVKKVWKQVDPAKLPAGEYKATFELRQDGKVIQERTITGNGTETFADLDKYRKDNTEYVYTITEKAGNFTTTKTNENGAVVYTNVPTETEKITLRAEKTWTGVKTPSDYTATIELYKNNVLQYSKQITGNSSVEFTNLEKYDENNKAINYTLREKTLDGFINHAPSIKGNVYTFINEKVYENPKDGEIGTTVSAMVNDKVQSATATDALTITPQVAEQLKTVTDTIEYKNLVPNEKYKVSGTLYKVENGKQTEVIATAEKVFAADEDGNGTWDLDFNVDGLLQENTKYVVFEKAVSLKPLVDTNNDNEPDSPQTGTHEDPKDPSQTVVVKPKYPNPGDPDIKTTVRVGEKVANENTPAILTSEEVQSATTVVDTIKYSNLVPNKDYKVTGRLYKVSDAKAIYDEMQKEENKGKTSVEIATILGLSPISTKDATLNSGNGSGDWEIEFDVTGKLEIGNEYVAFERAESLVPLIDTNNDNEPDVPQTGTHEDPKDPSQTVVVKPRTPEVVTIKAQKVWQDADGAKVSDEDANAYTVDIELYRNNEKVDTKTITGNGEAIFSDLAKADESGVAYTYTLRETNASVLSHLESQVTENDVTIFTNRIDKTDIPPKGFLEFSKVDISTRAAVEGATIQFYKEGEATPFLTGTTNAEGKIVPETAQGETNRVQPNGSIVLEVGKYFFKETNAPEGYVLNDKEQPFEITNEGITKAEFENKKESGFATIIKKDGDTQENIGGAVFDIYKKGENGKPSGAVIQQVAVSAEGSQIELETGRYIAVEISAPAGYVLPDNMLDRYKDFTVDRNNTQDSPIEVVVFNKKPSVPVEPTTSSMLYLTKVDETGRPLAGATLSIFRQGETDPIITGVTNENGKLEVQTASGAQSFNILEDGRIKLENGEYVVRETNAPEGYVLDETERAFILSEQSMNATVTIVNQKEKPQPISITVRKSWTNVQDGKTAADYRATIQLLQNGSIIATKEVVGDMEIVFDNLAKLDSNGNEYNYEVKEVESNEFKLVVNTREGDVVTLQNEIIVPPVPPTPIIPNEPNEPNEPPTPPTPPTIPSIPSIPNTPPVIPNEPNDPPTPPTEIEEEETPLAKPTQSDEPPTVIEEDVPTSVPSTTPEITEIEEDVPLGLPKTGSADTTALGLMLLALGMMVARKRK